MDLIRASKNNLQLIKKLNKYSNLQIRYKQILATEKIVDNSNQQLNEIKVSNDIIKKLEKLSLVGFENETGIKRLESAIKFTEKLKNFTIDEKISPLYSVLENENLHLRNDCITDGNYRKKILKNTTLSEDNYFVAPPGNIPFEK
ncbi:glutamyl-tRNA(Gln) amidotransferase subunit C, mitochondrial-like [Aphidius gifuensis]|uniref:glutamyl-tRNA(Gln) amidotransferase subunit C, mitochondrial-like n=1 Tax=Aphidius gifuensis TaxID=684658 RepID=UPI001CDC2EA8|nr:glutamyl-tRNA(Gln) amidotransferase subunit C, mitochondrial-like [Aphidius gifuensis]